MKNTKHVRIIDSTLNKDKNAKSMIGKIFEVKDIDYKDKTLSIEEKDYDGYHIWFNFSDVQECFPDFIKDGYVVGVGDKVNNNLTVIGSRKVDGRFVIDTYFKDNENDNYYYDINGTHIITPLYNLTPKETIKLFGKEYPKHEVEQALSNIKAIS